MTPSETQTHENGVEWGYPSGTGPSAMTRPLVCSVPESPETSLAPTSLPHPDLSPPRTGEHEEQPVATPGGRFVSRVGGARARDTGFEVLHHCCAGLDVHQATIWACRRRIGSPGAVELEVHPFPTTTAGLRRLVAWLEGEGVTIVAMESTGVYWKPVFNILEGRLPVILVKAQHLKHVPGRKSDVIDCQGIAQLLQCGLLKASFVPPRPIRQLRDLTRRRTQLARERASVVDRIGKILEGANIKLAGAVSDILGVSGRALLTAIGRGVDDPTALAELARKSSRRKIPALKAALDGLTDDHHRFLLSQALEQVEALEGLIEDLGDRVEEAMAVEPLASARRRSVTIPGIGATAAEVILAEIGADMSQFPSAGHLGSWAGVSPGKDQSGKKRRPAKTTKGSQWLRTTLVQVAWAASRSKGTCFQRQYARQSPRWGRKKALIAVAHRIVALIHLRLERGQDDEEPKVA
jgi:transposase